MVYACDAILRNDRNAPHTCLAATVVVVAAVNTHSQIRIFA